MERLRSGEHTRPRVSWSAPSPTTSWHVLYFLLDERKQSARRRLPHAARVLPGAKNARLKRGLGHHQKFLNPMAQARRRKARAEAQRAQKKDELLFFMYCKVTVWPLVASHAPIPSSALSAPLRETNPECALCGTYPARITSSPAAPSHCNVQGRPSPAVANCLRACLKARPVRGPGPQKTVILVDSCRPRALTRRRICVGYASPNRL
jgi:hypothetical protein